MDTAQLKKAGMVILGLGVLAIGIHFWSTEKLHLYLGIGAAVGGGAMLAVSMLKK
ncbi:MAG: hypothetical protein H7210_06945 [Pyrinomonadaceae bacterium]|nr:hypothetical protein [Phycisphaerales bacterium]